MIGVEKFKQISTDTLQFATLVVILAGLMGLGEALAPGFLRPEHVFSILEDLSMLGVVSIAQTLVIMSGGIDISVGAIMYFSSSTAAILMNGERFYLPFFTCLILGAAIGAINGAGVAMLGIPPIVMTLAMMIILTGVVFLYTGGTPGGEAAPLLRQMVVGKLGLIHGTTIIWIIVTILFVIILKKTTYGRKIQAIGSNPRAAYCSGINVKWITFTVYTLSGLLSALAGLLLLGYMRIPYFFYKGGLGTEFMLKSIAATVLGGTLFVGGKGGVERTFIGVVLLGMLFSILTMLGLPEVGKLIAQGVLIISIVAIYLRTRITQRR